MRTALAVLVAALGGCTPSAPPADSVRLGYQKWGTFSILKASGRLEAAGLRVDWVEFPSGPPLLEALNAGSLDLGHTGDAPPLFAQAAGVPFVYVGASSASPDSSAILAPPDSSVRSAADLRGKRVGFTKGSSGHTLVLRALESAGLTPADIEPVHLAPADGRAALASGAIDAWSVWDPFLAAAEQGSAARRAVGGRGLVAGREFYLASRTAVDTRPELVARVLTELTRVKGWAKDHDGEVNRLLADQTGLPVEVVALAESRRVRYSTTAMTAELVAEQQRLADRYVELGLLPDRIDVRAAVHPVDLVGKD